MNELLLHNAAEKLRREMKSKNSAEPATMIQDKVAEALDLFCKQDDDLARAILNSNKTFAECCEEILKDTKQAQYISDELAYSRAVKFYIPDADIEFQMKVITPKSTKNISLMDLLEV